MIPFQTPTGTVYMTLDQWLALDEVGIRSLQASNDVDPLSVRSPTGHDLIDDFELPDISEFEPNDRKKTKENKEKD